MMIYLIHSLRYVTGMKTPSLLKAPPGITQTMEVGREKDKTHVLDEEGLETVFKESCDLETEDKTKEFSSDKSESGKEEDDTSKMDETS